MAKNKEEKPAISQKELDKLIEEYSFKAPDRSVDGTIKTERYETGIIMFDLLLNGGLPKGRVVSIGAEPGAGKTTILIQACGNIVEKYNKKIYYLDVEGGATYELWEDMGYANLLYDKNTNPDGKAYLLSVNTIQEIAKITKMVSQDPETAVIVVDSATQVTDQLALDDEYLGTNKNDVGATARVWSKAAKPINSIVAHSELCMFLVHQARVNLSNFMPKIEAAAGNALKHLTSVEIWGKKRSWLGEGGVFVKKRNEAIGSYIKLTTEKNRLTRPFAVVEMPVFFGRGVSNKWAYKQWLEEHSVANQATGEVTPVLKKAGAGYYTLTLPSGEYKCRGDEDMWKMIDEHYTEIETYVKDNGGFKLNYLTDDETTD